MSRYRQRISTPSSGISMRLVSSSPTGPAIPARSVCIATGFARFTCRTRMVIGSRSTTTDRRLGRCEQVGDTNYVSVSINAADTCEEQRHAQSFYSGLGGNLSKGAGSVAALEFCALICSNACSCRSNLNSSSLARALG